MYRAGACVVWYMKRDFFREGNMGHDWMKEHGTLPNPADLAKTHVCLGTINTDSPETAYQAMQGENWSPMGEARPFILERRAEGLAHTSMSIGDVVVIAGKAHLVDHGGFVAL